MFVIELHLCKSDLGEVSEADCQVFRLTAENPASPAMCHTTSLLSVPTEVNERTLPGRVLPPGP